MTVRLRTVRLLVKVAWLMVKATLALLYWLTTR